MSAATRRSKAGNTLSNGPPTGQAWTWMTSVMEGSLTHRALGIHALRVLSFLKHEHATHGGAENGNLAAPYQQLELWGVTANDVAKGLAQLVAVGFIERTSKGFMRSGGGEASRYALTWLPTRWGKSDAKAPTHKWAKVIDQLASEGIGDVRATRAWLSTEVARSSRSSSATHPKRLPPRNIEGTAQVQGDRRLQVQGEKRRHGA